MQSSSIFVIRETVMSLVRTSKKTRLIHCKTSTYFGDCTTIFYSTQLVYCSSGSSRKKLYSFWPIPSMHICQADQSAADDTSCFRSWYVYVTRVYVETLVPSLLIHKCIYTHVRVLHVVCTTNHHSRSSGFHLRTVAGGWNKSSDRTTSSIGWAVIQ